MSFLHTEGYARQSGLLNVSPTRNIPRRHRDRLTRTAANQESITDDTVYPPAAAL